MDNRYDTAQKLIDLIYHPATIATDLSKDVAPDANSFAEGGRVNRLDGTTGESQRARRPGNGVMLDDGATGKGIPFTFDDSGHNRTPYSVKSPYRPEDSSSAGDTSADAVIDSFLEFAKQQENANPKKEAHNNGRWSLKNPMKAGTRPSATDISSDEQGC